MKKINQYILEKFKISNDILVDEVNQEALENVTQLMIDFADEISLEQKYSIKPVKAGNNWVINVWFKKSHNMNWKDIKHKFQTFTLKYIKKWSDLKLLGYRIPPVAKAGPKITFIVK